MKKGLKCLMVLLAAVCVLGLTACNDKTDTTGSSGEPHTHSYGEWTVTEKASCTKDGLKERMCACGEKQTETIAATGHGATELRNAQDATCTTAGYTGDTYCTVCDEKLAVGQEIAAKGHSYGEWVVVKAVTCTEDGLKERVCACGEKQTETIVADGHVFGEWYELIAATGTDSGLKERVCACGEKQTEEIPATGRMNLSIETEWKDGKLLARVVLSGGTGITNGKVTVSYDASAFSLTAVEMVMPCGIYDTDMRTAGTLSVTWVGSESVESQTLFTLTLTPAENAQQLCLGARLDEAYADQQPLTADPVAVEMSLSFAVSTDKGGNMQ